MHSIQVGFSQPQPVVPLLFALLCCHLLPGAASSPLYNVPMQFSCCAVCGFEQVVPNVLLWLLDAPCGTGGLSRLPGCMYRSQPYCQVIQMAQSQCGKLIHAECAAAVGVCHPLLKGIRVGRDHMIRRRVCWQLFAGVLNASACTRLDVLQGEPSE